MNRYYYITLLILLTQGQIHAQPHRYIVNPVSFSSRSNDEFSPVFYKRGIVFCSNLSDNSLVRFKDENSRLFKIFYVMKRGNSGWTYAKLLAKEITTGFNDGPVTFNDSCNIMFYSRNNSIKSSMKNISDTSNKTGIYTAKSVNGIWSDISPFIWNDVLFSFGTPALSPDGMRLYFSSDKPGGMGGMDLYYCNRLGNRWDKPVNLGPVINTSKNESFPFTPGYGKLFFASDGHEGFGGKDIFYTREINGAWIAPVQLDSAVNSTFDDFGIVTDSTSENGYFSSNRRNSDDIFSFNSAPLEFSACDTIMQNRYCFTFYDEQHAEIDTLPVTYQWYFGDGILHTGKEVKHCFPGAGKYTVRLSIIDNITGNSLAKQVEYNVELENINQATISSDSIGTVNKPISFEGLITDLKGVSVTDYLWNFGDGFKTGGPLVSKTFKKKGNYMVKLGLVTGKDSLGVIQKVCYMKKIKID